LPLLEDVAFYNVQQIKKLKEWERKPSLKKAEAEAEKVEQNLGANDKKGILLKKMIYPVLHHLELATKFLENNINYIVGSHLTTKLLGWDGSLIWYQSLDDQVVSSLNLTIPIYLIKIKHKVMWVYASFKSKELSLEGVC